MDSWTSRLKQRMKELGFTQEKLADKFEVTRGAIAHYLAGRRMPSLKDFKKLAVILKCDPAWLQFGVIGREPKPTKPVKTPIAGVPIIDWKSVNEFSTPDRIIHNKTEFVPCIAHQKDKSRLFALRVKGDAMVAPAGHAQNFHEGTILIIDPDKEPIHGSYVVAVLPNAKEATFKQYVIDGGTKYLKPLNPQYPMVRVEKNTVITGVITSSLWLFT